MYLPTGHHKAKKNILVYQSMVLQALNLENRSHNYN